MMREYCVEVKVACSVEQVYDLWRNLENVPRWIPLIKEVKVLPGSEDLSRWKFGLGFPLLTEWTSHITQYIPNKLIAWESVSGLPNRGCAEFFPTEEHGCRLRLSVAFELPGGIVGSFLETIGIDRWLEANLVETLNRFQSLIEEEVLRKT
jgi:uncharacterized membrane protein